MTQVNSSSTTTQLEIIQHEISQLEAIVSGLETTLKAYTALHSLWGHLSEREEATIEGYQKQIDEAQHTISVKQLEIAALRHIDKLLH